MTSDPLAPRVDIIIPTYNRAHLIAGAIRAALDQSWWNIRLTVVDDASTDATQEAVRPFFNDPRFNYIKLANNLGTAQAKNAGLLLTDGAAVTFHDSDDIPHRDKILHQVRVLTAQDIGADECLNWKLANKVAGSRLDVSAALTHHELILPDGRRVEIRRDISLLDDVFPNLQMGAQVPGEWTHINSGLFRTDVFKRLGGFEDCIEEDREFRNRLILNGEIIWIVPELLLTKIETPDSLTQSAVSDYDSARRKSDRQMVWKKVEDWRRTGVVSPAPLHIPDLGVSFASQPELLTRRDMPMSDETSAQVDRILAEHSAAQVAAQ
ncbi:glycosyltransferase family 2 protein [Gymnodinialimonas ceratoperidinii]|uniref:Glycosyltransferase family 2 protein n=1 Tax=Gymnodinialimonas ceratoperidinii TaxID=2856823 RepID=A0A8F6TW69_9RHOB|nr:glycosyltransferase family 2 protein [Gymnodinialimonas ceratoperidinii]QXT39048.1 glycosyltransferase family 2 protein [Gymnodinialimonas ceratoperidinii]